MIPDKIKEIMQKLLDNNYEAYIVGGAVRDKVLGFEPHDYDVFTNATGEQILELFPYGKVLGNDERQAKILTVIVGGVEVSQYRKSGDRTETGSSLKEHCATCDFTINSMAMDINEKIIDYEHGKWDIRSKELKFVGDSDERIREDPLRLLRAIRFACKFNFHFTGATYLYNIENFCKDVHIQRIRDEFIKIIKEDGSVEYMHDFEVLKWIMPELYHKNHFVYGGDHHDETPFQHMINSFNEACKITDNPMLRFACLVHDIGKGECRTEKDGSIHFYEHEVVGKDIVSKIMKRMSFSNDKMNYVKRLVKCHMYSYTDNPSKKSYIRFFRKLEDNKIPIEDYVMLIYCDHQGNTMKSRIKFGDFIKGSWVYQKYYEIKYSPEPMRVTDLELSGKDIANMDVPEGVGVGIILNKAFDMVMIGELKNERACLVQWAKVVCAVWATQGKLE